MNRAASIFKVFHFSQKGASIIAVIAIMLILAVMGAALVSLITTGSDISVNQLQSEQAFYIAEGGKEFILANRTFPNYSTQGATINLGVIGSTVSNFKVDTPTYLSLPGIDNIVTAIPVNSTANFPVPGRIVIDSEVIAYTATDATPSFIGATRGAGGTTAAAHASGNAVYPVTTVTPDLIAVGDLTINVASTIGFVIPGVIKIDSEYIYCTSTNTPLTTQFTNCIRGYKNTTPAAHAVNSNVFQYIVTSTGTVGNSTRVVRAGVDGGVSSGIAFDFANSGSGNNSSSISWSHTVSGTNRLLIVGVSIKNNGVPSQTVSTVTYGAALLTYLNSVSNGTNVRVEIWYLIAPATGTNTITVSLTSSKTAVVGGSVSLTGVDQTTPIDAAFVSATGNTITPSVNIVTVTNNAWVFDTMAALTDVVATVGADQTQRWNGTAGTGAPGSTTRIRGTGSTEGPKSPAGTVTMSWNLASVQQWALGAVALKPATGSLSVLTHEEVY